MSHDLARPHDQGAMWLYRHQPSKVSYHPLKFGGNRYCGSGNMFLVYHVILQGYVIKESCDFMGRNPSRQVIILPSLVAIDTLVVETCFLVFHLIRRNDVTSTWLINLICIKFCRCTCLPNLVIIGLIVIEISIFTSILTWIPWKRLNSPPRSAILRYLKIQKYRFTIPKSGIRLTEKE